VPFRTEAEPLREQGALARRGPWRWLLLSGAGDLAATKRRISSYVIGERAKREDRMDVDEQIRACRLDDTQRINELADCRATAALPHGPGLPRQAP
jgi:hypothetical protein